METSEIYAGLKTHPLTKDCIERVCASDELPDKSTLKYNEDGITFIVVNLDPSYLPGSHWVAIRLGASKKIITEYFDSYGQDPDETIQTYIGANYIAQTKQLQSPMSTICGQWCMYYILYRCRGYSLTEFVSQFNKNLKLNDKIVNEYINSEFTGAHEPLMDLDFWASQISQSMLETFGTK